MNAKFSNLKKNIMGTTDFDLQIEGMRKPQEFIVYPIGGSDDATKITIQSDKRFGFLNLETGKGEITQNYPNGAYAVHYTMDSIKGKLVNFELAPVDLQALKMHLFTSADGSAGESGVISDNSGAINVLGEL
jgi:hypothetical protein